MTRPIRISKVTAIIETRVCEEKRKKESSLSSNLSFFESKRSSFFWILIECVYVCIYMSFDKVIKIKFKVNGERLFLVLFLVALHFRHYEKIYIYIYLRLRRESRYYSCGASAFLVSDFYSFAFETCLRYKTRPRFSTFREPQP